MPRECSRHNILVPLGHDRGAHGRHVLLNPLTGQADLLSGQEADAIKAGRLPEGISDGDMEDRGYWSEPSKDESRYKNAYLDFIDGREQDEVQIFFVPTYACNFACSYCYQAEYGPEPGSGSRAHKIVDAFYEYIDGAFAGRSKYLTLFGGEPLLPGEGHRELIAHFLDEAKARSLDVAVVTNGYYLESYLDTLARASIREIQVTLDGPREVHNARRPLHGGEGTYDKVVRGIDAAIGRNFPVNLRMVVDKDNASELPDLARMAIDRGWTRSDGFKTQVGRNYELHSCQAEQSKLFDRLEMARMLYDLLKTHPWMEEFIRPEFSITRHVADNGALPGPLFDACPGCKTEWAFDMGGGIYSCTATVGKTDEKLGTFWPEISLDQDTVDEWEDRDILSIEECRDCDVRLLCGGGCASIAKNKHGRLRAPDCRPIKELIDLGMDLYVVSKEK